MSLHQPFPVLAANSGAQTGDIRRIFAFSSNLAFTGDAGISVRTGISAPINDQATAGDATYEGGYKERQLAKTRGILLL